MIKIGGSTLGQHDTTLEDLAAFQRDGGRAVVVHGGGNSITTWLNRLNLESHFVQGLRVTDAPAMEVVVAVLAGLINKQLVAGMSLRGVRAIGLCGVDGDLASARIQDPSLGLVGEITRVDTKSLDTLLSAGFLPVVAPIARGCNEDAGALLNINADTMAGELALALSASSLIFLTDVPAVRGAGGESIRRLTDREAGELIKTGVINAGMIPKVQACRRAIQGGGRARIVDGREPGALLRALSGEGGTLFEGGEG